MALGIYNIGKCICGLSYEPAGPPQRKTGLFAFPDLLRRLALISPRAFQALSHNQHLLHTLDSKFRQGIIPYREIYLAGFDAEYYPDQERVVLGIRYPADVKNYKEAESKILAGKFAVSLRTLGIADLTEREFLNLYQILQQLGGPKKVRSFTVVEKRRTGCLTHNPDGTVNFAFERAELNR